MLSRAVTDIVLGIIYAFFVEIVAYIIIFIAVFFVGPSFGSATKVMLGIPTSIMEQAWGVLIAQVIAYIALLLFAWETTKIRILPGAAKRELAIIVIATTIFVAIFGYMVDVAPPRIFEYIRALIGVSIVSGFIGGIAGYIGSSI